MLGVCTVKERWPEVSLGKMETLKCYDVGKNKDDLDDKQEYIL